MHNIEWKPELSIGIESIDNDHRKLIELTNQLIGAIDREFPQEEILAIFDELEAYTHYHFGREESFMDTHCTLDEMKEEIRKHKAQHRYFTGRLTVLKETLEHATKKSVSYEIVEFLLHWLIDHIINEDLKLTHCLKVHRHHRGSWLQRMTDTLRKKTSLHQRLWFILALPLLFFVLQTFFINYNAYNRYSELQKVQSVTQAVVNINNIITQLQKERGLSTAYILSGYHHFQEKLLQQRKQTDEALKEGLYSQKTLHSYVNIGTGVSVLQQLVKIRTTLDAHHLSKEESLSYYTNFIKTLIGIIKEISYLPFNTIDQNTYSPILLLLHLNEVQGLMRNEGVISLEAKQTSTKHFQELLQTKKNYLHTFNLLAPTYLKDAVAQIEASDNTKDIKHLQKQILNGTLHGNKAAQEWFTATSLKIEKYKKVIEQTLQQIEHDAYLQKKHFSTLILTVWVIFIVIILFIGISIYLFNESILHPLSVLTSALYKLSEGDKSVYFSTVNKKDAISRMEHSYNHLRRSLIKADYSNILMELQELKTQKYERLSAEDPLTAIFNRRAFIHALEHEIIEVKKSNKPLSLLTLDIDHFKQINDTFGHDTGDVVLQRFVQRIKTLIRDNDIFARIGGEEFAVLLPNTSHKGAQTLAGKIINEIAALDLNTVAAGLKMTVSIGIAVYKNNTSSKVLLKEADEQLYEAKRSGRNRFCG
jgi:diguanylate cyclase (GGDEF)-like protein/hemerythrin-like metal-binding protein